MGTRRGSSAPFPPLCHSSSATARAARSFFLGGDACAAAPAARPSRLSSVTPHSSLRYIFSARRLRGAKDNAIEDTLMDLKDKAPDFILPDEDGQRVALKD